MVKCEESSLSDLQMATFSLCPHVETEREKSLFLEIHNSIELGPHPYNLI